MSAKQVKSTAKSHGTHTDDNHKALWSGRFAEGPDAAAVEFETSIFVDERMALDDIHGSIAHAEMLGECEIISKKEAYPCCWNADNIGYYAFLRYIRLVYYE